MQIIGLDIGTTSVCGICFDAQNEEVIKTITRSNCAMYQGEFAWEKLQDANILFEVIESILQEIMKDAQNVRGIGISGQMHGIVYLNDNGEPVSPLYTWQDGRGDKIYKDGISYATWLSEKTGYRMATGYGSVTHFYNVINGFVPKEAKTFCTIPDFVAMKLANMTKPVIHPSNAASLGLYDLEKKQFDADAIARAGMDPTFFPQVKDGYHMLGKTKQGIPIAIAIGDNQASVLGSVDDFESTILINVGTGSQISCIVKGAPENCAVDVRPFVRDYYLLVGSSLCGGRAYAILEKFLRETVMQITGMQIDSVYAAMNECMSDYVSPNQPLVVETTFSGTRQEPEQRGSVRNIDINNLTMQNLCDGFVTGMVRELYELYIQLEPYLCVRPTKIVGAGNGLRLNTYLAKQVSNMFGMPLHIPVNKEEAALGAAKFGFQMTEHSHKNCAV